jgi:hypothetical protein
VRGKLRALRGVSERQPTAEIPSVRARDLIEPSSPLAICLLPEQLVLALLERFSAASALATRLDRLRYRLITIASYRASPAYNPSRTTPITV